MYVNLSCIGHAVGDRFAMCGSVVLEESDGYRKSLHFTRLSHPFHDIIPSS